MTVPLSKSREQALLLILMVLQFTAIVDFMIMMPLSPNLMREFHIGTAQFGMLVSAYSFAAGASALLAASLADRFDRRTALLVAYAGLGVATLGCALASTHITLLVARAVAGMFGGVLGSIAFAIVGDVVPAERRGRAMSVIMLAFSLSAVAGVPLGLIFAHHLGWRMPFALLSGVCALLWLAAWKIVPSVRGHLSAAHTSLIEGYRDLLREPNHWWAFLMTGLVMYSSFSIIPYIAPSMVANVGLPESQLAYIYLTGGAVTLISRPWVGRLTDRHPYQNVLTALIFASFVPILLVSHTPSLALGWQLGIAALFFIFVSGRFIPATAMVTAATQPRLRGRVMSFNAAVQNLASGLAAQVAGLIMSKGPHGELLHFEWVGYLSCVVGLMAVFVAQRVRRVS